MLKLVRISALVLLLACSARAGEVQNGSPQPPPPSSPSSTSNTAQDESAPTGAEEDVPSDTADPLTEAAWSVFNSVLALL
jgi:hypothetical protein